jgi:O-antigen ligase
MESGGQTRMPLRRWSRWRLGRDDVRLALNGTIAWLIPLAVIWAIYFSPRHIVSAQSAVTYLIALFVVLLASRRPDRSLLILIILFPFQGLLLSKLFALGVPASVVKHLGAWKESLAIGVLIAAVRSLLATDKRLDALDRLALGFVTVVGLYAVFQTRIVVGAPAPSSVRLLGFRETASFVLLLFAARHAPLGRQFARRAARAVFVVGSIVALLGIYEAIFPSSWNSFVVKTMQYTRYEQVVLGTTPANFNNITIYGTIGGGQFVRIGSVFLDELALSWYLLLPLAIGIERIVRARATSLQVLMTLAIGAALLLTQTRSAIAAGVVIVLLTLPYAVGRGRHWRLRAGLLIAALAVVAIPAAFAIGVAKRVEAASNGSDQSTAGHIGGFWGGVDRIEQNPLGVGLGTGAGTGQRFDVSSDLIPENNYLEIGDELGVGPMLLFVLLTLALLLWLRRAALRTAEPLAMAAFTAGIGLAISAWFLQTWSNFAVAWTYWGVAGAVLIAARQRATAPAPAANQSTELAPIVPTAEPATPSASW